MSEEPTQNLSDGNMRLILERFDAMDARLTSLEDKVDRRLQETRPIWEAVQEELKQVNVRLEKIEKEVKSTRRMFHATLEDITTVQEHLEDRVEELEGRNT